MKATLSWKRVRKIEEDVVLIKRKSKLKEMIIKNKKRVGFRSAFKL